MGYASKFYDPQAAHEYYEKHKKTKGRTSTKGMSQSQKQMASYVKAQLQDEKKTANQQVSESAAAEKQQAREHLSSECKKKVEALREKLKNMPKAQREKAKKMIQEKIADIRGDAAMSKKDAVGNISESARNSKAANQADYENKLAEAYDEIRKGK